MFCVVRSKPGERGTNVRMTDGKYAVSKAEVDKLRAELDDPLYRRFRVCWIAKAAIPERPSTEWRERYHLHLAQYDYCYLSLRSQYQHRYRRRRCQYFFKSKYSRFFYADSPDFKFCIYSRNDDERFCFFIATDDDDGAYACDDPF
ncbi:hypothetical protein D9757_010767 [Collybiopsis confluens]|uniref:Uncharacterized protein n=1 Tax=Collybiopsis confluens TaxID=2823264 RepID=A0A8H5H8K4_9AGAR|nr:hypothetical protein D9757_010767 [Collybiopsis confluens]